MVKQPKPPAAPATVRIRAIIERAWHSDGDFRQGEAVEVSRADADALIERGHAELAEPIAVARNG